MEEQMRFKPFYSFKCYTTAPVIYIFSQKFIDSFFKSYDSMPFYEYYFEPVDKDGMVVMQFFHDDFEKGMKAKNHFEILIYCGRQPLGFCITLCKTSKE